MRPDSAAGDARLNGQDAVRQGGPLYREEVEALGKKPKADKNLQNTVAELERNPVNSKHAAKLQQDQDDRRKRSSR